VSSCVLDASAVLAFFSHEPGSEVVDERLVVGAAISSVNWAEVLSTLADKGLPPREAIRDATESGLFERLRVYSFQAVDAAAAADLRTPARSAGLSLADRACIALAARLGVPAVTADRDWARVRLPVEIELVR
jgi:ribonuclease VapC